MAVIWRIFFTLAAINFIVLAIFVFLVTIQFEAVLSGSIRERLEVVVENFAHHRASHHDSIVRDTGTASPLDDVSNRRTDGDLADHRSVNLSANR